MVNMPGGPELLVIVVIALVVLGPQQLPKAMRTMGSVMAEIRKISSGFQNEMRSAMGSLTDDEPTKPQSGSMGPVETTASEATHGGDREVVARNPEPASAQAPVESESTPPAVSPVDRAAG